MREDVREPYALEDFYFEGIGNLLVRGPIFRVTFFTWEQDENGLYRLGVRRGHCPAENVPACAEQALAAVAQATMSRLTKPISKLLC